ncbi:MAG: anti-sigma factor [Solirubrobacteraceae bacterium]
MPRLGARRQRRPSRAARAPAAASTRLRRRVLEAVRREQESAAQSDPRSAPTRPWTFAAGIVLIAAIALIAVLARDRSSPDERPASPAKINHTAATVHAWLQQIGSHAELIVSGMPEPPIGEVYEVWLNRASGPPQPTDALFTVTHAGNGSVDVPGPLRGVRAVTVTSEPLGGSSSPTSAPVLHLRFSG